MSNFKVNNLATFSVFILLCNHYLYLVPKYFHYSKLKPLTH